jgi:hypothetical protein
MLSLRFSGGDSIGTTLRRMWDDQLTVGEVELRPR